MAKVYVRTGEPVNLETWRFFEKYGAVIEEMEKYARDNQEMISLEFRGQDDGDRQTWLERTYYAGKRELCDSITLFEKGSVLASQYELRERVEK